MFSKMVSKLKKIVKNAEIGSNPDDPDSYQKWLSIQKVNSKKLLPFKYMPKISVIMPVYNVDLIWLEKAITSVERQIYPNWELCIVDDNSSNFDLRNFLLKKQSDKIKVKINASNKHISITSNEALNLATGEFIALLDHDDELTPDALYEVVNVLNQDPSIDLIYSDEDKLTIDGRRVYPAFKPNWDKELLFSFMYVGHLGVYRKKIIDDIGGFRVGFEGAQDYDLILRFTEKTNKVFHLEKILYHWRMIPGSTAVEVGSKDYAYDRGRIALEQSLIRRGFTNVRVCEDHRIRGNYYVQCAPDKSQLITVFIIGTNKSKQSITIGDYSNNIEIIEMNSINEIVNYIEEIKGTNIAFLHDTIKIIDPDWLYKLLMYSKREECGIVTGRILSETNKIVYAGGFLEKRTEGIFVSYPDYGKKSDEFGYLGRIRRTQSVTISFEDIFMVKKSILSDYLNKKNLISFNFTEFCLITARKYQNIYFPHLTFVTCRDFKYYKSEEFLTADFEVEEKFLNDKIYYNNGNIQMRM